MASPRIPPLKSPFLEFTQDREGRILSGTMSAEWQMYFGQVAQFQEAVGMALNLSDIQDALNVTEASLKSTLTTDVQAIIDAGAASLFGNDYKGVWAAGSYAIGNVAYHSGFFYECDEARTSANTQNPATDTVGWSLRSYEVMLTGNVNVDLTSVRTAIQAAIDAQGTASFGSDYKGAWAAGIFAVGAVSYHSGAFYTCTVARVAANTDDPATDTASWEIQVSESGGLEAAVQAAIDAQGAIQFGNDYDGKWVSGAYPVGKVAFFDGKFYRVKTAPGNNTFPVLKRFSIPTAWGSGESLSTLRARAVSANEDQTFVPPDPITSDAPPPAADNYMLRWRFLIRSSERWNRITLLMPDGCDDWLHVYLMRSTPGGSKTGSEIGSVKQLSYSTVAATVNFDITESDWGAAASDGYYYAMVEAYFGEKSGGEISDWRIGYRAGVAVTPPETVNATGGLQNIDLTGYQNPAADTSSWDVVDSLRQTARDELGYANFGLDYKGAWVAGVFAVGNVLFYGGRYYECSVVRAVTDTDDPATDASSWDVVGSNIDLTGIESSLTDVDAKLDSTRTDIAGVDTKLDSTRTDISDAIQAQIDAIGANAYGESYQGAWAAGTFAVEDVSYYDGMFYECIVVRAATDASNPSVDTTGWTVADSSVTVDLGSIETSLSGLETEVGSTRTDISDAIQAQIDAIGANAYGESYQGEWAAGTFAVGDVVYWDGKFYECDAARNSSHTSNPMLDTSSWSVVASTVTVDLSAIESTLSTLETKLDSTRTDIGDALQSQIDAIGSNSYGDAYDGEWAVGAYATERIVYWVGKFYECDTARTQANTNNPASDTASWSVIASSVTVDLSSIETTLTGLETDISASQQAQIDAIGSNAYGNSYKGAWEAGDFSVGNISFHAGMFYKCTVLRTSTNTDDPTVDTASWDVADTSVTIDLSSIESTLSDLETEVGSTRTDISAARQQQIDAAARIAYGEDYKGTWAAGTFAVGDVVFHSEKFYECDEARTSANTQNPSVNTTAWSIIKSLKQGQAETMSGLTRGVQDTIDAQARAIFGTDYRGTWEIGEFAVADVVYWVSKFYRCTARRDGTSTNNPATDTASWELTRTDTQAIIDAAARTAFGDAYTGLWEAGDHDVGDVTYYAGFFYECILARTSANTSTPSVNVNGWSIQEGVRSVVKQAIDAGVESVGAAQFGEDFKGAWASGNHDVGNIRSYERRYYRCKVARTSTNTGDPSTDTTGWEIIGSAKTILAQQQSAIDAIGASNYGDRYKGKWESGTHAVGDYRSHDGRYYLCKVARTSSNTDDPAADNTGWEAVGSSFALEGSLETASQSQIDAAASIVFGSDYKGVWKAGVYSVGNVAYDSTEKSFFECDIARTASNTSRPSIDSSSWTVIVARQAGVYAARDRAATSLPTTGKEGDLVWVSGDSIFGSWDLGISVPSGEIHPSGVAVKANGDILIVGANDKVYTYSNGSWDSGIDAPAGESDLRGVAVKANGDILIVGTGTDKVYTYSNGSWDSGLDIPSGELHPQGMAVKANGDILIVGAGTDKVYTYSNGSWDSGLDIPSGETFPYGMAVKANGDILIVGENDKVYTYSNGSWDSGIDAPAGESDLRGVAVKANGDILIVGTTTDIVYTANLLRQLDRYIWLSGGWELTAIRLVD